MGGDAVLLQSTMRSKASLERNLILTDLAGSVTTYPDQEYRCIHMQSCYIADASMPTGLSSPTVFGQEGELMHLPLSQSPDSPEVQARFR